MTPTELNTLKTKAKLALRISAATNVFDDEIEDLIKAAEKEMLDRKAMHSGQMDDPRVVRAIITFVRAHFGEPENPERLVESYKEQCAEMMNTSGYTEWS